MAHYITVDYCHTIIGFLKENDIKFKVGCVPEACKSKTVKMAIIPLSLFKDMYGCDDRAAIICRSEYIFGRTGSWMIINDIKYWVYCLGYTGSDHEQRTQDAFIDKALRAGMLLTDIGDLIYREEHPEEHEDNWTDGLWG